MRLLHHRIAFAILFLFLLPMGVNAAELLIPGGEIVGLQLHNGTVTVAAFDDTLGANAQAAGIRIGDEILSINENTVSCAEDVRSALGQNAGTVTLSIRRNGKQHILTLLPQQTENGPRLGIHLKQGITGIGTVTFYDPEGTRFGMLGHGVSDAGGSLLNMTRGTVYHARVVSAKRGVCGEPGLLKGRADPLDVCGRLYRNAPQGVFGITAQIPRTAPIPAAEYEQIQTGAATIRSTVSDDRVQEYSVEILKIYPEDRRDGRNFLLKVTDPALLSATGGIVQGMSGSPIIQDGKLVGAVTHVLVNDPTRGYGIFIENMLTAAS